MRLVRSPLRFEGFSPEWFTAGSVLALSKWGAMNSRSDWADSDGLGTCDDSLIRTRASSTLYSHELLCAMTHGSAAENLKVTLLMPLPLGVDYAWSYYQYEYNPSQPLQ